jgi:O-antigen ligase
MDSNFASEYSSALPFLRLKTTEGLNSHNSFIEIGLNLGLAGLIAAFFVIGSVARRIVNVRPQELPSVYQALPTYLAGSFVAGLVNQNFEASLFSAGSALCIVFWFIVAAIFCLPSGDSARAKTTPGERTGPYRSRERVVAPGVRKPIPRESSDGR